MSLVFFIKQTGVPLGSMLAGAVVPPLALLGNWQLSLVAAGLALSVTQLGGIGGRVVWGNVADRWLGARRMLLMLASMMTLGALTSAYLTADTPQALVIAILVAFGASAIGWNGVYLAEVARRARPGMASMARGGTLAFTFFGRGAGAAHVRGFVGFVWHLPRRLCGPHGHGQHQRHGALFQPAAALSIVFQLANKIRSIQA
jgi:MFS family permease